MNPALQRSSHALPPGRVQIAEAWAASPGTGKRSAKGRWRVGYISLEAEVPAMIAMLFGVP